MHAVGVVPENAEIFCRRLQRGKTADYIGAVNYSGGVFVLRNTPDTLYLIVAAYQLFHYVHIRTIGVHRHRNKLESKMLGYREMPIVARNRAKELSALYLLPRRGAADTVRHSVAYKLVHHRKAAVSADYRVHGVRAHHVRQQALCLRDSVKPAVVAAVLTAFTVQQAVVIENVQHFHRKLQLLL